MTTTDNTLPDFEALAAAKRERRRELARERKRKQRERDARFKMRTFHLRLAAVQRVDLRRAATAAGYMDQGEYLIHLVNRDLERLGLERCRPGELKGDE